MTRGPIFRTGHLATSRVEAFSDGVLAVVITLLVFGIKLPPGLRSNAALWNAFTRLAPVLAAWVVSFAFVLTFWVNHHYFFANLKHTDRGLLWLNGFFLLAISLTPFPTGLIGEYPGFIAPLALLSGTMMLASLAFALMRFYASFHAGLLREHIERAHARRAMLWSGMAPCMYALAAVLAFFWQPGSLAIQVAVLAFFFIRPSLPVARHEGK